MNTITYANGIGFPVHITLEADGLLLSNAAEDFRLHLTGDNLAADLIRWGRDLRQSAGVIRPDTPRPNRHFQHVDTPEPPPPISLANIAAAPTDADKWSLLIQHFASLAMCTNQEDQTFFRNLAEDCKYHYKQAVGQPYRDSLTALDPPTAPPPALGQLTADLIRLRPHLGSIITPAGKANKSEIARLLNLPPGGATIWPYLQEVAAALEAEYQKAA
jgi:hypothetical protein